MTYEELVARLTAALDSTDPVTDGDANESDEQQAEYVLARHRPLLTNGLDGCYRPRAPKMPATAHIKLL